MFARLRLLLSWLPTLLVLAGLGAIGWWGSASDWQPSRMMPWLVRTPDASKKEAREPAQPENPATSPGPIVLESEETASQAGIDADAVRRQAVTRFVEAPAVLAFDQTRYAQLASRASGTVWRVHAQAGDTVKKGDVLALVASADVGKAKADFLTAFVQVEIRDRSLARLQAASGSVRDAQVRDAQLALREARVQLVNTRQALGNLGLPPLDLDALRGLSDEKVAAQVRDLGLPGALPRSDDVPANLLPLVAPFPGKIIRRELVIGEMTGPDRTAYVLADVSRLWVQMDVRLEDVDRLAVEQPVTFETTGTGQLTEGVLKWISAEVDPRTRTVRARADVSNPDGRLRPATFGKARVHVQRDGAAVTVPSGSMQWDGQVRRVFVRRDSKTYEPRLVLPGASAAGRTELLDPRLLMAAGLAGRLSAGGAVALPVTAWLPAAEIVLAPLVPGEQVVTTGSHVLKSEMLRSRIGGED